ncbi:MAG: hypothetical protein ACJAZ2_000805 [Glaciecola sp.]
MKRICSILLLLTLFACDSSLQILSAKKQNMIPGREGVKPYSKYLVEVELTSVSTLKVDSVLVFETGNQCRKATHCIRDTKTSNVVMEVKTFGKYIVEASVKESNAVVEGACKGEVNKIVLYYQVNGRSKTTEITSFTEETIRRR